MSEVWALSEATDRFDERYNVGVVDAMPAATEGRLGMARAAASQAFALRGCVIGPDRVWDPGVVVVEGERIKEVGGSIPSGVTVVDTDGVILPGMIDLHGHPEFNVFSAWEPPRRYINRWAWRDSAEYKIVVRQPWDRLTGAPSLLRDLTRYAEVRALVGGVTAIQGASALYPDRTEALVRNVDLPIFGRHRAGSIIDFDGVKLAKRQQLQQRMDRGELNALYIHVAEGLASNPRAWREFDDVAAAGFLRRETVVIHGTALDEGRLGELRDARGKLVWSPQSNLRLYGETTQAARAIELGIPVGLGADWLPSGSASLLAELKVARERLVQQGVQLTEKQLSRKLVRMVTQDAAAIAGLSEWLGELSPGRPADITVLERVHEDPYRSVVEADPAEVELVTIGGFLAYGRSDWMDLLAPSPDVEPLLAWGKEMKLDTSYAASPGAGFPVRLANLRRQLLERHPHTGPIFA
jgi:cytosine/adenosine deaminase-related metal-dependent hydrolase